MYKFVNISLYNFLVLVNPSIPSISHKCFVFGWYWDNYSRIKWSFIKLIPGIDLMNLRFLSFSYGYQYLFAWHVGQISWIWGILEKQYLYVNLYAIIIKYCSGEYSLKGFIGLAPALQVSVSKFRMLDSLGYFLPPVMTTAERPSGYVTSKQRKKIMD
jgi:hypothetical protein